MTYRTAKHAILPIAKLTIKIKDMITKGIEADLDDESKFKNWEIR